MASWSPPARGRRPLPKSQLRHPFPRHGTRGKRTKPTAGALWQRRRPSILAEKTNSPDRNRRSRKRNSFRSRRGQAETVWRVAIQGRQQRPHKRISTMKSLLRAPPHRVPADHGTLPPQRRAIHSSARVRQGRRISRPAKTFDFTHDRSASAPLLLRQTATEILPSSGSLGNTESLPVLNLQRPSVRMPRYFLNSPPIGSLGTQAEMMAGLRSVESSAPPKG